MVLAVFVAGVGAAVVLAVCAAVTAAVVLALGVDVHVVKVSIFLLLCSFIQPCLCTPCTVPWQRNNGGSCGSLARSPITPYSFFLRQQHQRALGIAHGCGPIVYDHAHGRGFCLDPGG